MSQGTLGDLKNIGGKGGGSITAALFLQEFVENAKWAHIDMAGMFSWRGAQRGIFVTYFANFEFSTYF